MFVTNWISTTKIQKISEITNFFRHYFLSRTEVRYTLNVVNLYFIFSKDKVSPFSPVALIKLTLLMITL